MKPHPLKPASYLLIYFFLITTIACQKTGSRSTITTGTGTPPPDSSTSTVYVLGYSSDTLYYWKNGVPVVVSAAPGAYGSGLAVSGTDVYISGGVLEYDTVARHLVDTAAYWKNGILTVLPDTTHDVQTYGIAVSGNDVYVVGTISYDDTSVFVPYSATTPPLDYAKFGRVAVCWKNGQPSLLPGAALVFQYNGMGESAYDDVLSGVFATGSDVYVVGGSREWQDGNTGSLHFTLYWKDGSPIDLTNNLTGVTPDSTTGIYAPSATAIYATGTDVYVAGNQYLNFNPQMSQALYWKNGTANFLTTGPATAHASAVYVAGSDVYVAGVIQQPGGVEHAVYWKNGLVTTLDSSSTITAGNYIAVAGTDVYVAGGVISSSGITSPVYWKNGKMTRLSSGGVVIGMAVK